LKLTQVMRYRKHLKDIVEAYRTKNKAIHEKIAEAHHFLMMGCEKCEGAPPDHLDGRYCKRCYGIIRREREKVAKEAKAGE